jgi:hypothetical protein
MEQICLSNLPEIALTIAGGIVTVASFAANFVVKMDKAHTVWGKLINWTALNFTVVKKK